MVQENTIAISELSFTTRSNHFLSKNQVGRKVKLSICRMIAQNCNKIRPMSIKNKSRVNDFENFENQLYI